MEKPKRVTLTVGIILVTAGLIMGGRYLIRNQAKIQNTILIPELSRDARAGQVAFATYCVDCHGKDAAGTDKGPPLVNQIYAPFHHGDFSFVRAVTLGVPQHHWLFGGMPAQPQVGRQEIDEIIVYIRELQKANGIK